MKKCLVEFLDERIGIVKFVCLDLELVILEDVDKTASFSLERASKRRMCTWIVG